MPNYKLTIEYNGADFSGSQVQSRDLSEIEEAKPRTVQGELEKALKIYFRTSENIVTNFSGRTDAGVHAIGQVVNFKIDDELLSSVSSEYENIIEENPDKFLIGLNGILPEDLVLVKVKRVADEFNARFDAKSREYLYKIFVRRHKPVLRLDSLTWVKEPLDFDAMAAHAKKFLGKQDFADYSKPDEQLNSTECNVLEAELIKESKICFKFRIKADRFLRHMVRRIVGELIEVGKRVAAGEKYDPEHFAFISESGFNQELVKIKINKSAPAEGLTLMKLEY
ncbi:MAG: tRNA pseudouridine synthase A [Candidatus Caenarcaniphilales bacterium]|nr:tRNA pseudouridine synthase A [Candidatus Caenarcaniphilales bacterium]